MLLFAFATSLAFAQRQKIRSEFDKDDGWAQKAAIFFPKYHFTLEAPRLSLTSEVSRSGITVPNQILATSNWIGANASWSSNGNPGWNGTGVPNAIGAVANHGVSTSSVTTQDTGATVTVGTISLTNNSNNSWSFTLTNSITLNQDGAGAGFATISNTNTSATATNFLSLGAGTLTLADDLLVSNTGASTNTTGAIQLTSTIGGSGNVTFSNASTAISQTGSIRVQTGTNTFTGSVLVQKGTVTHNNAASFGNSANVITLGQSGQGSAALLSTAGVIVANDIVVASGSGGTLTLGALSTGAAGYSGTVTLNGDLTITSAVTNAAGLGFTNTISGAGGLTKVGTGILALSGANTFDGDATVSAGTLQLGSNGVVSGGVISTGPVGKGTLTLGDTTTLRSGSTAARTIQNNLSLSGNVTLGDNTNNGALTFNSTDGANTLTTAATVTLTANTTLTTLSLVTIADVISGSFTLAKAGASTLTLSGANAYTGLTTVGTGVLNIQNNTALGTTAAGTSATSGAALQLQGGIAVGNEALTLDGTGIGSSGALRNISGDNSWGGTITINSTTRINSDSGTLTLDVASGNAITGSNDALQFGGAGNVTINDTIATGTGTLTKDGAGTLTLSGANTYTGATTVSAGVLNIQNNTALGTTAGGATVSSGAALELQGGIAVGAETLSLDGTGISSGGALRNISGDNSWAGTITLANTSTHRINSDSGTLTLAAISETGNSPKTLTFGGAGNVIVNGIIGGGPDIGIAKDGAGTVTLNAANTYEIGTTVTAGTLLVNNTTGSGTGTGAVTVSNSGTVLGGTGTIDGAVTVNANAKLQGGTGTTGATQKLTLTGGLTLNDNSIIQLALGPSLAHSTLTRSGTDTWTFDSNQAFTFIDLGATTGTYQDIITGIANPPSEGSWTITNSGLAGTFTYDGANIDLNLTAVPEPGTWIGGALAVVVVGWSQWRRLRRLVRGAA